MTATRRDIYAPIIAGVIAKHTGQPMKEIRAALRQKWDDIDGERAYWPYKVWCSEVSFQLGLKPRPRVGVAKVMEQERQGQCSLLDMERSGLAAR